MKLYSISITDTKMYILDAIARSDEPMNATSISKLDSPSKSKLNSQSKSKLNSEKKEKTHLQPTIQRSVVTLRHEGLVRIEESLNIKNVKKNDLFFTDAGLCNYMLQLDSYYKKKGKLKRDHETEEIIELLKKHDYVNYGIKCFISSFENLNNLKKSDITTDRDLDLAIFLFSQALYSACLKTLSDINMIPFDNKKKNIKEKNYIYVEFAEVIHDSFTFNLFNRLNYYFPVDSDNTMFAKIGEFVLAEFKKPEVKDTIIGELEIELIEFDRYSNLLDDFKKG